MKSFMDCRRWHVCCYHRRGDGDESDGDEWDGEEWDGEEKVIEGQKKKAKASKTSKNKAGTTTYPWDASSYIGPVGMKDGSATRRKDKDGWWCWTNKRWDAAGIKKIKANYIQ